MPLKAGTQLGPYEVLGPLGAGGMGEVYRAADPRLRREVAIKVLPAGVADDPDRLRRFKTEALAAASLNHPNILAVYDVGEGTAQDAPYVVSELLSGTSLREALESGALPARQALDVAVQIAHGLAAAHAQGIVHRDIKPDNVFLTPDGRVKILDFGLAKLTSRETAADDTRTRTGVALTERGVIVGTPGYMSPEQIRDAPVDHRSDIFSFGVVLYEMLSGRRAFTGSTSVETMSAVLKDDPPSLAIASRAVPAGLERLVIRCLQKQPALRYDSMKDVAYQIEAMSLDSMTAPSLSVPSDNSGRRRTILLTAAAIGIAGLAGAAGLWWGRSMAEGPAPTYTRLTFRRGTIGSARFAPDGQQIVYSAAWQGGRGELFSARTDSTEARPLGVPGMVVTSISSSGEMALRQGDGTLARAPVAGGAPREWLENIATAAWGPDGNAIAVVRVERGRQRLEFPLGKVLYETAATLANLSVSADGTQLAVSETPTGMGSFPSIIVVDLAGHKRVLSEGWRAIRGLAWSPDGSEIWFAASKTDAGGRSLFAVAKNGTVRQLTHVPANLTLHDVSRDGRLLVERADDRYEVMGMLAGDTKERNLSVVDYNGLSDLSVDGRMLIITEDGETGRHMLLRRADATAVARLGDGGAFGLSADGRLIVTVNTGPAHGFALVPTGPGEIRVVEHQPFDAYLWASWFPDGNRIVFVASEPGKGNRMYVQDLGGGPARAIAPEGVTFQTGASPVSPNGEWVAALDPNRLAVLYPTTGGDPRPLPGVVPGELPVRWSADGRTLYLYRQAGMLPAPVYRLDVASGTKTVWKEVGPTDTAGVRTLGHFVVTPDGASYAFNYRRLLSDLYLVTGVR